jgi:exopolysaccharide production protein ExoZ
VFTLSYVLAVSAACRFGERDNCSRGLDPTDIASSLLILPQEGQPVLSVGWSLEHEIIFYTIAALVCVALHMPVVRLLQAVTLLGCVGVIVHVVIPSITGDPVWDYHLFSLYHFQFAAGIAVFMMKDRLADANPLLMFALGVLAFVMTGIGTAWIVGAEADIEVNRAGLSGLVSVLGYAISSVAFLSGLLGAEARGLLSGGTTLQALTVKALVLIGSASYALYLEHPLAYGVIGKVDRALHLGVASLIPALGVAFGATLIAGIVWFVSIERPFLRAAHRALAPRPLRLGA